MATKRYEVIGRPIGAFSSVLDFRGVGDVFAAELDKDTETRLIAAGAIRVLPAEKKETRGKTKDKN